VKKPGPKPISQICGVYGIYNCKTQNIYIGSSKRIKTRLIGHWSLLNRKKHHCKILQKEFNKYKESNFCKLVLVQCSGKELWKQEQVWLNKTNGHLLNTATISGIPFLDPEVRRLNIIRMNSKEMRKKRRECALGNTNWLGKKHSEESKKKTSIALKKLWAEKKLHDTGVG
jgi:group I intron endonuclease